VEPTNSELDTWYVSRGDTNLGPYATSAVIEAVAKGDIRAEDYVWRPGWEGWHLAGEVSWLFQPPLVQEQTVQPPLVQEQTTQPPLVQEQTTSGIPDQAAPQIKNEAPQIKDEQQNKKPGCFRRIKRNFLFGLGSFLILTWISLLIQVAQKGEYEFAAVALVLMPLSVVVIRAAMKAPPNQSNLHAVVGWLIGFFVLDAAILGVVGVILLAIQK